MCAETEGATVVLCPSRRSGPEPSRGSAPERAGDDRTAARGLPAGVPHAGHGSDGRRPHQDSAVFIFYLEFDLIRLYGRKKIQNIL